MVLHHRLDGGFGFHGGHRFGDQFEGFRADDVDAQDLAVFLVGDHLHEAFVAAQDAGLAVRRERKFADLHLEALRARLRFGEADAADAGLGVGGARNAIPIDRHGRLAGHVRHRDHAFHGGDVRQLRRAGHHIADRVDARLAGLLVLVHLDEAAVEFDLGVLEPDVFGVRLAADGDQQRLGFHLFLLAVREGRAVSATPLSVFWMFSAFAPVSQRMPVFLKYALQFFRNFFVFDGHHARQHFEDRDLGAEAVEDGGELDAHRARADDRHGLRDAGRSRISMLVRMVLASGCRPGSMRASEPVAMMMFLASSVCVAAVGHFDFDLAAARRALP